MPNTTEGHPSTASTLNTVQPSACLDRNIHDNELGRPIQSHDTMADPEADQDADVEGDTRQAPHLAWPATVIPVRAANRFNGPYAESSNQ